MGKYCRKIDFGGNRKFFLVLHGPNLNKLGLEPHIYGSTTLKEIDEILKDLARKNQVGLECFQSNHEGELIDKIHTSSDRGNLRESLLTPVDTLTQVLLLEMRY